MRVNHLRLVKGECERGEGDWGERKNDDALQ